jgi:hypothetical protein
MNQMAVTGAVGQGRGIVGWTQRGGTLAIMMGAWRGLPSRRMVAVRSCSSRRAAAASSHSSRVIWMKVTTQRLTRTLSLQKQ